MAGNPDGSAELEQKLVSGVVFLLLGDAERGVLGNVVFDVDVAFELLKAGNIGIFGPKVQVIRRQPGCRRSSIYIDYHDQGNRTEHVSEAPN